jgi:hypothetical protein
LRHDAHDGFGVFHPASNIFFASSSETTQERLSFRTEK